MVLFTMSAALSSAEQCSLPAHLCVEKLLEAEGIKIEGKRRRCRRQQLVVNQRRSC